MSAKPRADSRLKTLQAKRQESIIEHMRDHKLPETAAWLAADGLQTSSAALSEFWSWWHLQRQLEKNASTVETLLHSLQVTRPDWTPDRVQAAGQAFFSALAMEQKDVKGWVLTQKLGLERDQLALDQEKFQRETCALFLKWFADRQAKEIAAGTGTNSDKIERLGALMFGEDWKQT
ncbi:MAG: hypothetical protein ACYDH9_08160 [Limisphaerales bacterium]